MEEVVMKGGLGIKAKPEPSGLARPQTRRIASGFFPDAGRFLTPPCRRIIRFFPDVKVVYAMLSGSSRRLSSADPRTCGPTGSLSTKI